LNRTALVAGGIALGTVVAGVLLWPAPPPPEPPAASAPRAALPAGPTELPAAPATPAGPPATTLADAVLKAALVDRLRAARLPRELAERLAAGDVAEVARRLAAAREPGSAALLAELAALCHEPAAGGGGDAASEARAALGAAGRDPATSATLEALVAATRDAQRRLAAGCAAASFDPGAIERSLQASARNGDAASLEQLALEGHGDIGKLTSAALLGAPRAQLRLGLDRSRDQPAIARSWLEAAAKGDADAEAYLGSCLLTGCAAAPDPAAARAAFESAARRGAPFALGLLATGAGDDVHRWSASGALVAPLPPPSPEALGLEAPARYAWAAFAGRLAAHGCFGFDLRLAADALAAAPRLAQELSPVDASAGEQAAADLEAASGAAARRARGCE
jgi:hypothetical protein